MKTKSKTYDDATKHNCCCVRSAATPGWSPIFLLLTLKHLQRRNGAIRHDEKSYWNSGHTGIHAGRQKPEERRPLRQIEKGGHFLQKHIHSAALRRPMLLHLVAAGPPNQQQPATAARRWWCRRQQQHMGQPKQQ